MLEGAGPFTEPSLDAQRYALAEAEIQRTRDEQDQLSVNVLQVLRVHLGRIDDELRAFTALGELRGQLLARRENLSEAVAPTSLQREERQSWSTALYENIDLIDHRDEVERLIDEFQNGGTPVARLLRNAENFPQFADVSAAYHMELTRRNDALALDTPLRGAAYGRDNAYCWITYGRCANRRGAHRMNSRAPDRMGW